jgi:hypothetical protein
VQLHTEVKENAIKEHDKTRSILLEAVRDLDTTRATSRSMKTDLSMNKDQELKIKQRAENHILRSLRTESLSERYYRIVQAHASTFEWIFEDPAAEDLPWSDFAKWLRSDQGIYWINGKAGSGKSTLMRYIYDHDRTRSLLRDWSGKMSLTIVSFFFWNSGTPDQKSQDGLLGCLIFELLSQNRDLIPVVLPDQWHDEYVEPIEWQQDFHWTRNVLRQAFENLRTQDQIRICLFIDGLDEYESDEDKNYEDIISFFVNLASSLNVKICLSSRPWLVFEDGFRLYPNLRLQDLTFNDISRYVNDKINGHERMRELRLIHPESANDLIVEIVTKAAGVFLWVKLAVNSLLDGFVNRDRISDLKRRLRELPADLESFYKHILVKHIPHFYQEQSSQLFQIVQADELGYKAFVRSSGRGRPPPPPPPLNLLILSLAEEEHDLSIMSQSKQLLSSEDVWYRSKEMPAKLKSRCGGLLEASKYLTTYHPGCVQYLHRTVRDFLYRPEIKLLLLSRTKQSFNPDEVLLRAWVHYLKYVKLDSRQRLLHIPGNLHVSMLVQSALQHANLAMKATGYPYVDILDELDSVVDSHCTSLGGTLDQLDLRKSGAHWANFLNLYNRHSPTDIGTKTNQDSFLGLAVSFGLTAYVGEQVKKSGKKAGRPLLDYLAYPISPIKSDMVILLLTNGADPNGIFSGSSIWQYMLEHIEILGETKFFFPSETDDYRKVLTCTLKLFVENEAHPNILCTHIKNVGGPKKRPQYFAHFSTPGKIFSPYGLYPETKLAEAIKSRGGIEFWDSVQLQSTDWDDAEAEAERAKAGASQLLETMLERQKPKKQPKKPNNRWRAAGRVHHHQNWRQP